MAEIYKFILQLIYMMSKTEVMYWRYLKLDEYLDIDEDNI